MRQMDSMRLRLKLSTPERADDSNTGRGGEWWRVSTVVLWTTMDGRVLAVQLARTGGQPHNGHPLPQLCKAQKDPRSLSYCPTLNEGPHVNQHSWGTSRRLRSHFWSLRLLLGLLLDHILRRTTFQGSVVCIGSIETIQLASYTESISP